jgi:Lysylphosphatidylglycerol synthase TM region
VDVPALRAGRTLTLLNGLRPGQSAVWLSRFIYVVAGLSLHLALAWACFTAYRSFPLSPAPVAGAALLYLMAHLLRALRLAAIVAEPTIGFRQIVTAQFVGAAGSLALPFKLGEIIRLNEIFVVVDGIGRAILIIWIERLFDAIILIVLLCLWLQSAPAERYTILPLVITFGVFSAVTVIVAWVVPENVNALALYTLRRYRGPRATDVLRVLDWTYRLIRRGRLLVHRRIATLLLLTAMIWLLEIATIMTAHIGEVQNVESAALALLKSLSAVITGTVVILTTWRGEQPDPILVYRLTVALPFLACSLVLWYWYLTGRLGLGQRRK